jgi:hypothetical protein
MRAKDQPCVGMTKNCRVRTVQVEVIHSSKVCLSLSTNESDTLGFSTVTRLCLMSVAVASMKVSDKNRNVHAPVAVHIVVESQLFILLDASVCKDAHSYMLPNCPFGNITVGITAVVCEATDASSLSGIDILEIRSMDSKRMAYSNTNTPHPFVTS